jgi:hypothetical protein
MREAAALKAVFVADPAEAERRFAEPDNLQVVDE